MSAARSCGLSASTRASIVAMKEPSGCVSEHVVEPAREVVPAEMPLDLGARTASPAEPHEFLQRAGAGAGRGRFGEDKRLDVEHRHVEIFGLMADVRRSVGAPA